MGVSEAVIKRILLNHSDTTTCNNIIFLDAAICNNITFLDATICNSITFL